MSLSDEERAVRESIASHANEMLNSRRDHFIIGPQTFAAAIWREPDNETTRPLFDKHGHETIDEGRTVSAAAIRLILDWAQNSWPMSLGDFLSGMFFGRAWDQKTPPWRLIPEAKSRLSADSLGFGHLYPSKETP